MDRLSVMNHEIFGALFDFHVGTKQDPFGELFDEGNIEGAFLSALEPAEARAALYGGAYWTSIWHGVGTRSRMVVTDIGREPRVKRFLDSDADHCGTCPPKARIYESYEAMLAITGGVPADGSDECHSNCRCWIEFENAQGGFSSIVQITGSLEPIFPSA